jgi:hypothetical protein
MINQHDQNLASIRACRDALILLADPTPEALADKLLEMWREDMRCAFGGELAEAVEFKPEYERRQAEKRADLIAAFQAAIAGDRKAQIEARVNRREEPPLY